MDYIAVRQHIDQNLKEPKKLDIVKVCKSDDNTEAKFLVSVAMWTHTVPNH